MNAEAVAAIAAAVAGVAAIVAGVAALYALGETFRTRHRSTVRTALTDLTSPEVAALRDRVATAGSRDPRYLDSENKAGLRRDTYALLWTLERLVSVPSTLRTTALAVDEAKLLYSHVDAIVAELSRVVAHEEKLGCFRPSTDRVNAVLSLLPDVRGPWNKLELAAPTQRLPTDCTHRSDGAAIAAANAPVS
jgi:hypothetical protein